MQAVPKYKAGGQSENPKPRESMDRKFSIAQRNMDTNGDMCGVLVVSKSNLAKVGGGYHYELPTSMPYGQTDIEFHHGIVSHVKVSNRTPEEPVQIYNPIAQDNPPESPVYKQATIDLIRQVSAVKEAENLVKEHFG